MSWNEADSIVIARLTESDIPAVMSLERAGQLEPWSAEGYRSEITNPDSFCRVAKSQNQIRGFLIARLIMSNSCAELYNIAVETSLKRKKIGGQLLNDLFKICADNNIQHIWLELRHSNTEALRFYEHFGFEEYGIRKKFYTNPVEDAITMVRRSKK